MNLDGEWFYDERVGVAGVYLGKPPDCLTHDCPPCIAKVQGEWHDGAWHLDQERCEALKRIVREHNAGVVMRTRGIYAVKNEDGWFARSTALFAAGYHDLESKFFFECPFEAILAADEWAREHIDGKEPT